MNATSFAVPLRATDESTFDRRRNLTSRRLSILWEQEVHSSSTGKNRSELRRVDYGNKEFLLVVRQAIRTISGRNSPSPTCSGSPHICPDWFCDDNEREAKPPLHANKRRVSRWNVPHNST